MAGAAGVRGRRARTRAPAPEVRIGTAGWTIAKSCAEAFPAEGSHLERYAALFTAVEINSSFYRPHRPATYARWAASVPANFRFAVKMPREITHKRRLEDGLDLLDRFLAEIAPLGDRLGPLLVQLPPSLDHDTAVAEPFFAALRDRFDGGVACEPRHPSWFTDAVDAWLAALRIARVASDPAVTPRAAEPGGWPDLVYRRLHGSPRTYYSAYPEATIEAVAQAIAGTAASTRENWCIFDNTALGEACKDALSLLQRL